MICYGDPCYGENCQVLGEFYFLVSFFIKSGLCLFLLSCLALLNLARLLRQCSGYLTWLNLLSVQPRRAHIISFPRSAREAHETHSLKRAIKDPGVTTGSVTLQIVRAKIIQCSFAFVIS